MAPHLHVIASASQIDQQTDWPIRYKKVVQCAKDTQLFMPQHLHVIAGSSHASQAADWPVRYIKELGCAETHETVHGTAPARSLQCQPNRPANQLA
jgi:hypothetical protein